MYVAWIFLLLDIYVGYVISVSNRNFNWHEDVSGADLAYGPALLTTFENSLITCLNACSDKLNYKAVTYNNVTSECICVENKTLVRPRAGNTLWNRHFDGFVYDDVLGWYIRISGHPVVNQAKADAFCWSLGARLAVLDTDEKLSFVKTRHDYTDDIFYVGATANDTLGIWTFLWSNGGAVDSNWNPNEPNQAAGDENCMALHYEGFLDLQCTSTYG